MYIKSLRIKNYKSFRDSGVIELAQGFNVIVGENNTGKTALVQAMSTRFVSTPHCSPITVPNRLISAVDTKSEVTMTCGLIGAEIASILASHPGRYTVSVPINHQTGYGIGEFIESFQYHMTIDMSFINGSLRLFSFSKPNQNDILQTNYGQHVIQVASDGTVSNINTVDSAPRRDVEGAIKDIFSKRFYSFDAERLNIGKSPIQPSVDLFPNASNLPGVLHQLRSGHTYRFARYIELVKRVFPAIKDITSKQLDGNESTLTNILVWFDDPANERDDLAVPLQQSGTGIGQVLAVLYLLVMSDFPRPIIIDEPQSFLHPGAVRRLFEIMHEHPKHQYIITTHSPSAIAAARPQNVLLVTKDGYESHVKQIDIKKNSEAQSVLAAVGARLSDVFGADNVLWVEGPTEEQCFPLIATQIAKQPLMGTAILAVLHTGDFESPDPDKTLRLYKKLSNSTGLMPPALAFVFDREERTDEAIDDIQRAGKAQGIAFHFLRRKLYENYLLEPEALHYLISTLDGFSEAPISIQDIENWISRNKWEKDYFGRAVSEKQQTADYWIAHVHGANLLDDLFKQLSDNRYTYYDYKIEYGRILTEWLIENKPEALQEIADLLKDILSRKDKRNPIAE